MQDHLVFARASGGVFARSVARPPWGLRLPGSIQLSLHTVTRGRAWLWLDDPDAAVELTPGDLALVRGGQDHHIADQPDQRICLPHEVFWAERTAGEDADDRSAAIFLCGAYRFAGDVGRGLIDSLPPVCVLRTAAHEPLHDVIALIARELSEPGAGQQTILDRLLDVLLIMAMRESFARNPQAPRWYQAAADSRIRAALHAIHASPDHLWTVPRLASLSGLSRAAFARSFERSLGIAPIQYLTDWRMTIARDYLRAGELSLEQIARRAGYTSPNAFAAAFRRYHGQPPGRWRHDEAKQPSDPPPAQPPGTSHQADSP
jgi:AraC-like DNA-binding protein